MQLLHTGLVAEVPTPLLALGIIYLVEGLSDLAWLAEKFYLKDELGASPAQVSLFLALASLPWCFKPLLGFVSDSLPLFGYRRRSYLVLASGAATGSWLYLSGSGNDLASTCWAVLLGSAAGALSDVVVDSMMVEQSRGEAHVSTSELQSLCWAAFAVGQIGTAAFSGSMVEQHGPRFVFALTAIFPLLTVAASLLVHEERVSPAEEAGRGGGQGADAAALASKDADPSPAAAAALAAAPADIAAAGSGWTRSVTAGAASDSSAVAGCAATAAAWVVAAQPALPRELGAEPDAARMGAAAARPTQHTTPTFPATASLSAAVTCPTASAPAAPSPASPAHAQLAPAARPEGLAQRLAAAADGARRELASQGSAVWGALSAPALAWPVAFLFALSATPAADDAVFYYQVEALGFSPSFLGGLQVAIAVASLGGVWVYNAAFKAVPLRSFLLYGNLLAVALQSFDLLLVARVNTWFGLDDHVFVLGGSVVTSVIENILAMPTLVLAARLCPKGLEVGCGARAVWANWDSAFSTSRTGPAYLGPVLRGRPSFSTTFLRAWGGRYAPDLQRGQFYRWLTSQVPHLNSHHLGANLALLAALGGPLERKYGTVRVVAVWTAAVVGGQLLSTAVEDTCRMVVGCSGGVFGLLGLFAADILLNFRTMRRPILRCAVVAVLVGLLLYALLAGGQRRGRGVVAGGGGRGEEGDNGNGLGGAGPWFSAPPPALTMALASRAELSAAPRPLGAAPAGAPACQPAAALDMAPPTGAVPAGAALPVAPHAGAAAAGRGPEGRAAGAASLGGAPKLGAPATPGEARGRTRLWRLERSSGGSSAGGMASGDWTAAAAPGAPGGNGAARAACVDSGAGEAGAAGAVGGAPMLPEGRHSPGPTAAPAGRAVPFPFPAELRRRAVRGPRRVLPGSDSDE
ncbi:Folate-biopterin transporter 1, chloroplastic [Tetrabaena socialis]|uniref:Folate-biopterin transporter 1, chloroplastic n=1 Tax=Tetrabaena socialis TaxID=47790 RepID=A0A2J8A5K2_9CHLO|nr:Folate-biopterin transporter 1, chloroplastic [Tetrabaena socialis]|eukprot:PNH07798.1 Folate-biopterin transporter 1, chloroplastic [Tetrabaena socialis]